MQRPNLLRAKTSTALLISVLLLAIVLPPVVGPYALSILTLIVILAVLAMSLDLLMGYTGMESLGQAAFFGVGGYTLAILTTRLHTSWEIAIVLALIAAVIAAAIGAALAVRLNGLFLLVMTLVFAQVLWGLAERWGQVTGGHLGLHGIERPIPFLESDLNFYYLSLVICVISGLLMHRLVRSPFGLTLRGIKDSELRMKTSGFNVWLHRYVIFVIAGFFAGVAGILYTYSTLFISPTILGTETSFEAMLMVIVGGTGTLIGPIIGAMVVTGLRNYLSIFVDHWIIVLGASYIITVFFAPRGILGLMPERWKTALGVAEIHDPEVVVGRLRAPEAGSSIGEPEGSRRPHQAAGAETLRIEGLGITFGEVHAVNEVSLTANVGTRRAILGPNGAGKTTLFNLITGVYQPTRGSIHLFGKDITAMPAHLRTRIGLSRTYQITNLFPSLTVIDNLRLGVLGVRSERFLLQRSARDLDTVNERCRELLERADLWEERASVVGNLSYGHQRQLELVVTLASDPSVLLLDEPAAGLSLAESRSMVRLIKNLDPALTVLIIEHDMDVAFEVASEVTVMHLGDVLAEGSVDEIRANEKVREVYFGGVHA